ncbi:hypothetical protein [Streptomyces minutiscleroticus]|uniref:Uncharacterized protein n=1 Tax=Streptomyces minutiscleroticus TaxID=68238 RepID=A0A918U7Y0_9ACTN|nr:hypothetical protein [Streptomyces minutiscleroticus]GGY05074.1 hypothetical protein GCM10010358_68060 [Streptomyces minutiscleroticus]
MPTSFLQQPEEPVSPFEVARAALVLLGDQWGVLPGPMGTTGHLHNGDGTPFTVGVCEAGHLYVRNDSQGDAAHLPVPPTADLAALAHAVARILPELF